MRLKGSGALLLIFVVIFSLIVLFVYFDRVGINEERALELAADARNPDGSLVFNQDPRLLSRCTRDSDPTIENPCVSVELSSFEGNPQWHVFVSCGPLCGNGVLINARTGEVEGFSIS